MRLGRSLAWMGLGQGLTVALQFVSTIVLARLLTPRETGVYAIGAATAGALTLLQEFGLQAMIIREPVLTPALERTAFTVNAAATVLLAAAITLMGAFGQSFLHSRGVADVLRVLALGSLLGILSFLPAAKLERDGQFRSISIVQTASGLANTILTVVLAVLGFSYMSIAWAALGSGALYTVLINVVGREHARLHLGFDAWRRVAGFATQMIAVSGVTSLSLRLSDIALGHIRGLTPLGLYGRASTLNALIWTNIHAVLGRVIFVDFAELVRSGVALRDRYLVTVEMVTGFLWPAFAGFAILSAPLIRTVYGARWVPASAPLALLALASMILVSISMTWELFVATGRLRDQTRIEFIRAGLALVAFVIGCEVSMTAAAGARVAEAAFAVLLYRPHLNRMTGTTTRDFLPAYARSFGVTVLAVAPAASLMAATGFSARTPIPAVLAAVALGLACWLVGLALLRHPLGHELRARTAPLVRRWRRTGAGPGDPVRGTTPAAPNPD